MTYAGSGYGLLVSHVDLGNVDTLPPNAVPSSSIGVSAFTNHVDLQWPAASDDANGTGVAYYQISRNGTLMATTGGLSFSDTTVVPNHLRLHADRGGLSR